MTDPYEVLEGKTPEEVMTSEPPAVDEPAPEAPNAEEEPAGEETPSQEAEASEQEPDKSETPSLEELRKTVAGLEKAVQAERKKRQEAESRMQGKDDPRPAPDVFEDPDGFRKHIASEIETRTFNERANMSEFLARREFPDLDEKVERFRVMAEENPALTQRVAQAVSPYHEIADIVSKAERLEKLENVDQVEKELRAKIEAEVRKEYDEKAQRNADLREKLPPSLVDASSKGSVKGHEYSGPTPLSNILPE